MSFDPCNRPLKIRVSISTPTLKVGAQWGVWGFIPSHFPKLPRAWNVTLELHFCPAPLQAFALVASPRLRLWQFPCLVCGLVGHKMVECPWFVEMQMMFKNKDAKTSINFDNIRLKTPNYFNQHGCNGDQKSKEWRIGVQGKGDFK